MVETSYGAGPTARKTFSATLPAAPPPGLVRHPLVSPETQIALLAAVDAAGVIGIGDLCGAIPDHPRPVSAVLALVDAGHLGIDLAAPFDASCAIWRTDRRDL